MYKAKNTVRIHDCDIAGILYFPRVFRFVHEALEDMMEDEGFGYDKVFHEESFVFVIAHCEADYLAHLRVADLIQVHVSVERIGNTSFTMFYQIYKSDSTLVASAKTVHVTLESKKRTKIIIPDKFRKALEKHLINENSST